MKKRINSIVFRFRGNVRIGFVIIIIVLAVIIAKERSIGINDGRFVIRIELLCSLLVDGFISIVIVISIHCLVFLSHFVVVGGESECALRLWDRSVNPEGRPKARDHDPLLFELHTARQAVGAFGDILYGAALVLVVDEEMQSPARQVQPHRDFVAVAVPNTIFLALFVCRKGTRFVRVAIAAEGGEVVVIDILKRSFSAETQ